MRRHHELIIPAAAGLPALAIYLKLRIREALQRKPKP